MERGVRELELHTRVENHAAVSFYAAAGWRVVDRITTVEHGTEYDEHVLTKRAQHTSILARSAWSAVGLLAVAIGAVGVFVPGLPTTVFFIIAAAASSTAILPGLPVWIGAFVPSLILAPFAIAFMSGIKS